VKEGTLDFAFWEAKTNIVSKCRRNYSFASTFVSLSICASIWCQK